MPAPKKADEDRRDKGALRLPLSERERARLDQLRGLIPRTVYIRSVIFGGEAQAPEAAQDAPSAPIPEPSAPAPPTKEEILLPPPGQPDAHGWHMRWNPRSPTAGTLSIAKAGEDWRAVDLIGVELEPRAEGFTLLRYADRSLVRTEEKEDSWPR